MLPDLRLQIASIMILLFIMANYLSAKRMNNYSHTAFLALLFSALTLSVSEIAYACSLNGRFLSINIMYRAYLSMLIIYLLMLQNYILVSIVKKSMKDMKVYYAIGATIAFSAIIAVLVAKTDYTNMMDGVFYCKGGAMIITQIALFLFAFNSFMLVFIKRQSIDDKRRFAMFAASISQIIVFLAQEYFRDNLIISIGYIVSIVCLYLISENPDKLLIEQLQFERDRANVANASKSSFVAHVSHEIRTPINAIIGMDEMIIRESKEEPIRQYATDISQAAQTLYGIINDVLDLSKMESGKMDIFPVEYDLNRLIYDAILPFKQRIKAKQIDFFIDINPSLPKSYYGDDVHIKQVVSNLISNAVKYTHEGFIKVSVDGDYKNGLIDLRFEIKDTGIGIKEEDISKLFVAFERIEESRNRNIEGTGLGMNITHNLLKLMGSRLNVSSVYGEGTIFSFTVTQRIVDQSPIGEFASFEKHQEMPNELNFEAPSVKILVVDDSEVNRRVFKSLLGRTQIRIDEADGGRRCLAMIMKEQYDLIFLDHLMPDMDGIETITKMRANKSHLNVKTPVIMLTANAIGDVKEIYMSSGFDAYLAKPVFVNELERLIRKYVPSYKIIESNAVETKEDDDKWNEKLPNIRGIDWVEALKHLPTRDVFYATIGEFYRSIDDEATQLDEYYANIDRDEMLELLRIKVHALKGSAALIGAGILSEGAKEIENAAHEKNRKLIHEKYPYMINYYRSFKERLSELGIQKLQSKSSVIDYPQVIALVEMVQLEMDDMNKDSAFDILKEIEAYDYPDDVNKEIIRLRNAVEQFDSEMVTQIVNRLVIKLRVLKNA